MSGPPVPMLFYLVRHLILIGHDLAAAEDEAMDLQHAVPVGSPVKITAGTYKDAAERGKLVTLPPRCRP